MVITVTCPSCSSSFPVDPAKIPLAGVSARCSACGDIFRVERPDEVAPEPVFTPPPPPPSRETPVSMEAPSFAAPSFDEGLSAGGLDEVKLVPPPSAPPVRAAAAPVPAVEPSSSAPGFRFGKRDPTDKAKRLARVLVSDMIMYNAQRHETALENGTLTQDFEDEIGKSWKEFVEQVGTDLAEGGGRQFWREALNEILAKGQELF